jgi:hypothetical protein
VLKVVSPTTLLRVTHLPHFGCVKFAVTLPTGPACWHASLGVLLQSQNTQPVCCWGTSLHRRRFGRASRGGSAVAGVSWSTWEPGHDLVWQIPRRQKLLQLPWLLSKP